MSLSSDEFLPEAARGHATRWSLRTGLGSARRVVARGIPVFLLVVSQAGRSAAQVDGLLTGEVSLGYTDNAFGAPSDPAPEAPPRVNTYFSLVTPGLVFVHEQPRSTYTAGYQRTFAFYFSEPDFNDTADAARFAGEFDVTPVDQLTIELASTYSSTSLLALSSSGSGGLVQLEGRYLDTVLTQVWRHEFNSEWTNVQGLTVAGSLPYERTEPEPSTYSLGVTDAIEYSQLRDTHAIELGATGSWAVEGYKPLLHEAERRILIGSLMYRWERDLSISWTSNARIGGSLQSFDGEGIEPGPLLGDLSLTFDREPVRAALSVGRSADMSLIVGRVFYSDIATLTAEYILSHRHNLLAVGATSFSRSRTPATEASTEVIDVWYSSAELVWDPEPVTVSLRYSHFWQIGDTDADVSVPELRRHVVLLTAASELELF